MSCKGHTVRDMKVSGWPRLPSLRELVDALSISSLCAGRYGERRAEERLSSTLGQHRVVRRLWEQVTREPDWVLGLGAEVGWC